MTIPTLAEKGKWATIVGIVLAIIVTVFVIIDYCKGVLPIDAIVYYILFAISGGFFILPSSLVIEYKDFKADIKD